MVDKFSPEQHKFADSKFFEDLEIGEKFYIPSRTLNDANFAAFQMASGDNHPIHYDVEYCRARGHANLLAHGFQVLIQTAAGAGIFPHVIGDSLIGFIEQSSHFRQPVYCGDTLYPAFTINELTQQNTTGILGVSITIHNQDRILCVSGNQRYLMRLE